MFSMHVGILLLFFMLKACLSLVMFVHAYSFKHV
jgi:hypothetical protein